MCWEALGIRSTILQKVRLDPQRHSLATHSLHFICTVVRHLTMPSWAGDISCPPPPPTSPPPKPSSKRDNVRAPSIITENTPKTDWCQEM